MNEDDILKRLKNLEEAVFGKTKGEKINKNDTFIEISTKIIKLLNPLRANFNEDDTLTFEAIIPDENETAYAHLTSFKTLFNEENDEDIAKLCSALSSKQRIIILKNLWKNKLSSGELAVLTGMTGGHLHHHLKDLLSLGLIVKEDSGKYTATNSGVNAYITAASLHRRLSYDNRENFKINLNNLGKTHSKEV